MHNYYQTRPKAHTQAEANASRSISSAVCQLLYAGKEYGMDIDLILMFAARVATFLLVIPLHESAHAWVAKKLGDDTAEQQGRISLSPFVHFDLFGTLLMILTGFGWAKPVPVNPLRFSKVKKNGKKVSMRGGMALTALAGPVSNLIAAFLSGLVYNIILCTQAGRTALLQMNAGNIVIGDKSYAFLSAAELLLQYLFIVNVGLAVFNLIPIPPLDGFNVLRYFTSEKVDRWFYEHQMIITRVFFALLLLMTFIPVIGSPLSVVSGFVCDLLWKAVSWIPTVFGG